MRIIPIEEPGGNAKEVAARIMDEVRKQPYGAWLRVEFDHGDPDVMAVYQELEFLGDVQIAGVGEHYIWVQCRVRFE